MSACQPQVEVPQFYNNQRKANMPRQTNPPTYIRAFSRRVKKARKDAGVINFASMAEKMGIKAHTYKQYEQRSVMPHFLIERFCALTDISIRELLTGNARKARRALELGDPPTE